MLSLALLAACGGDEETPPDGTDTVAPTVSITDDVSGVAEGDVTFSFTFSEDVGDSFAAEDVTVSGGTAGAFVRVSGTAATLVVSPPADMAGTLTVSVAAMSFEDAAGNTNVAAASAEQAYDTTSGADTTPPTVAITSDAGSVASGDVTFTFTFSEDVGASFAAEDVTVAGGTAGAFEMTSGTVSTLVVTPPADAQGTISVTVAAMSFEDAAGNQNVDAATAEQAFDTRVGGTFDGVVFADDYATGATFVPFTDSVNDVTVDTTEAQAGSASLKIVVPATGAFTGGALVLDPGVDVSSFDAVTFWAKADQDKAIDAAGFGNDADEALFNTEIIQLPVSASWRQYTIPIPDPAVLVTVPGIFHFAEGGGTGAYTLWLDEIRYVNLPAGTVTNPRVSFAPATEALAVGETATIGGVEIVYAVGGQDVRLVPAAPAFLEYTSSDAAVATVDTFGVITAVSDGTATITGALGAVAATGEVTVNVGAGCTPTGPNLAVNGDFERGDFSCIQQFLNGGSQSVSTMNPSEGTYAAHLEVAQMDADTLIKFANMSPGGFTEGETIYISFDMRGALAPGGVVFAEFFSELLGGGVSSAEILFGGGPIFPDANPATWTNFSTTALAGSDTAGGVTLQLKALSGGGTMADIYFDDICVSKTPCP